MALNITDMELYYYMNCGEALIAKITSDQQYT